MSFFGLHIAKSGLFVAQRGLNLTGHNMANVETEGYTRQRQVIESIAPAYVLGKFAPASKGKFGYGSWVEQVDRLRDKFIDKELRREYGNMGKFDSLADSFQYIETIFNSFSDINLSSAFASFFDALQQMTPENPSIELRASLQQSALRMCETFNHYYKQLVEAQTVQNDNIAVTVEGINDLLTNIAEINRHIATFELSGQKANDLRDKRDLMLDELAKLVDMDYSYDQNDHLHVSLLGQEMISHTTVSYLSVVPPSGTSPASFYNDIVARITDPATDPPDRDALIAQLESYIDTEIEYITPGDPSSGVASISILGEIAYDGTNTIALSDNIPGIGFYSVFIGDPAAPGAQPVDFVDARGEIAAFFQMRDGDESDYYGIPSVLNELNTLVRSLAQAFNDIHVGGWTYPNGSNASQTGIYFFEIPTDASGNPDYSKLTAGNIALTNDISNPDTGIYNIAISSVPVDLSSGNPNAGNNENMLKLVALASRSDIADVGNFEGYLKKIILDVSIQSAHVRTLQDGQSAVVNNLEMRRESVSGVSLDEETVNMMQYEDMYQACSRILTAIDDALDVLINKTGVVGR